jgi:hypothetical protein
MTQAQTQIHGKEIGNVNLLDMRNATEDSLAGIKRIGNVNLLIYARETANLVPRLNAGNINLSVEVPPETRLHQAMGQTTIGRDYFKNAAEPLCIVALGQVVVEQDVPLEDINRQLVKLVVLGQFICPETLAGAIESKARVMGQTVTYPSFVQTKLGDLTLDQSYLEALADGTDLAIVGDVRVPQVLPNDLLQQKLGKFFALSNTPILVHEENAQVLRAKLVPVLQPGVSQTMKIIPAGFALVEKPLDLDISLIEFLPGRKLFCTERVNIAAGVDSDMLDKYVDALKSEELILCPLALKGTLARKTNVFESRVVFYEDELMLIDGDRHLSAARLNHAPGKLTLVVTGELTIDPDVTPQVLGNKVLKVHNLGLITCNTEQAFVVESRLGLHDGEVVVLSTGEPEEDEGASEGRIGNINILEL